MGASLRSVRTSPFTSARLISEIGRWPQHSTTCLSTARLTPAPVLSVDKWSSANARKTAESVLAPPLFLAPSFSFLRLRVDAFPKVFAPFTRDLPNLGERHGGVVANPAWHRVRASRKAGDKHKRALIFLRAVLGHADAKSGIWASWRMIRSPVSAGLIAFKNRSVKSRFVAIVAPLINRRVLVQDNSGATKIGGNG
jgi:hypothetical protein